MQGTGVIELAELFVELDTTIEDHARELDNALDFELDDRLDEAVLRVTDEVLETLSIDALEEALEDDKDDSPPAELTDETDKALADETDRVLEDKTDSVLADLALDLVPSFPVFPAPPQAVSKIANSGLRTMLNLILLFIFHFFPIN